MSNLTLIDTGPLFALVDPKGQPDLHKRCVDILPGLRSPFITTWPVVTEALHLAGRRGGRPMQNLVARYFTTGLIELLSQTPADFVRMNELMEMYADRPMDVADASLVVAAERLEIWRIFSIDSGFYIYRTLAGGILDIVPGPLTAFRG